MAEEVFFDPETGVSLTTDEADDLVDELVDAYQQDADELVDELLDAEEPRTEEFRRSLGELLRDLFLVLAILGIGGVLEDRLRGQVERRLERQLRFLDGFIQVLLQHTIPLGSIHRRIGMYINSSRQAYWLAREERARQDGYTEERWEAIGDLNTCDPCFEADDMGYQPLGTFGEPGSGIVVLSPTTLCHGLTACRCRKSFR